MASRTFLCSFSKVSAMSLLVVLGRPSGPRVTAGIEWSMVCLGIGVAADRLDAPRQAISCMVVPMRIKSIASHLRPYVMLARRRTTINHAFAAAVAPSDVYDESAVANAMRVLDLNPRADLLCAYCGAPAETWDHVFATVKDSRFSGHGHRLGNLLPCCKPCNSKKGNKAWQVHLSSLTLHEDEKERRSALISAYLSQYATNDGESSDTADHRRLNEIRLEVLALLAEGDRVAAKIRAASCKGPFSDAEKDAPMDN